MKPEDMSLDELLNSEFCEPGFCDEPGEVNMWVPEEMARRLRRIAEECAHMRDGGEAFTIDYGCSESDLLIDVSTIHEILGVK